MHLWRHNYAKFKQILGQIGPYSPPTNFWTTSLKELKFCAITDNYNVFLRMEKNQENCVDYKLQRHNYAKFNRYQTKITSV